MMHAGRLMGKRQMERKDENRSVQMTGREHRVYCLFVVVL